MTIKTANSSGLIMGVLLASCVASGVAAAPGTADHRPTQVAEAAQARPAASVDEDEPTNCNKSRKRLWVEGEGWIVRRVTTCR